MATDLRGGRASLRHTAGPPATRHRANANRDGLTRAMLGLVDVYVESGRRIEWMGDGRALKEASRAPARTGAFKPLSLVGGFWDQAWGGR
jgi:hypothetical protein